MRFEVGQKIWIAEFSPLAPEHVTCPDCGGTGRLRVSFHDETQVSIDCRNCAPGYEAPTGWIIVHRQKASARQATITGLEMNGTKVRWHADGTENCWRQVDDDEVFDTEADAIAFAQRKAKEWEDRERAKIFEKEKDSKTWAWNASYHRRCLKEAQRQVEYHTSKLNVASLKAKEKVEA